MAEHAAGEHHGNGSGVVGVLGLGGGPVSDVQLAVIETKIPSRLDRLPWSRFHWRIVLGLGTAWVLDGLEVTIVGSVASRLTQHASGLSISPAGIGVAAALYVVGACAGALVFGHLTDRFGRKKLFLLTLGLYMVATAVTAFSFAPWFFYLFRMLTGAGIGGEYAAINSAIDELIPARARGRIDLIINGSYWIGSILGSALALLFLDESLFPADIGWRLTFVLGIVLAAAVMGVRRHVPESPRWLFIHGREAEAEAIVDRIEADVQERTGARLDPVHRTLKVRQRRTIGFRVIARAAFKQYPARSILCLSLFVGQAFIYNGITFNLGTLMTKFFGVSSGSTPVFLIMYAAANFVGPLVLGRLFDSVGRIPMISGTYIGSAVLGLLLAGLFVETGWLNKWTFIVVVMATFLLASAGASAAYLTSSEIFPMESRALSIAFFYAIGTAVGGITGPLLFGPMIATGSKGLVGVAFLIGAGLMAAGGVAELAFGVKAEQAQLEDIATPLTAEEAEDTTSPADASGPAGAGDGAPQPMAGGDDAAGPSGSVSAQAGAAEHRGRAAEHRAAAAESRASLPQGGTPTAVALERARSAEQRALVAEGSHGHKAVPEGARTGEGTRSEIEAPVHQFWAAMHDHRAEAIESNVAGRTEAAADAGRRADEAPEQARSLQYRLEAAGQQARAVAERGEQGVRTGGAPHAGGGEDRDVRARNEAAADAARIRSGVERCGTRGQQGIRRYRPGPGHLGRAFGSTAAGTSAEDALDHEIVAIERALRENGAMDRQELARVVGARYWGPGVFGEALRQLVAGGAARRLSRRLYAPPIVGDSAPGDAPGAGR